LPRCLHSINISTDPNLQGFQDCFWTNSKNECVCIIISYYEW